MLSKMKFTKCVTLSLCNNTKKLFESCHKAEPVIGFTNHTWIWHFSPMSGLHHQIEVHRVFGCKEICAAERKMHRVITKYDLPKWNLLLNSNEIFWSGLQNGMQ